MLFNEGKATFPDPKNTTFSVFTLNRISRLILISISNQIIIITTIMKAEVSSSEGQCKSCYEHNQLILLSCGHAFCVRCVTFAYHKHKLTMNRVSQTRCCLCEKVVELGDVELRMINQFTDQVLVPLIKEEEQGKNVKYHHTEIGASGKQFKSHEQSIEKLTPIGGRGFYSKCQSPKMGLASETYCVFHPDQELNVVCLSCQNSVLCLSCTAGKRHSTHAVKSLTKGMESIQEQISLTKLKCRENIGVLEVLKRKVDDRKMIVEERWEKARFSIKLHFDNLIELIQRKREEINQNCSEIFQKWTAEIMRDENRIHQALKASKRQADRLNTAPKMTGNVVERIKKSTIFIEEVKQFRKPILQCHDLSGMYQWEGVIRDLDSICEKVEKISPNINFQYLGATAIKNSRSEQKLLKETQCKRTRTNMVSLNSSRQKRDKKYTKTEQDERRNKSKANYKTESNTKLSKVNKNYPGYLVQYLEKNNPIDSFVENNPLTSSFKSTKMLSKSHLPGEDVKRKKEHTALIKERLERKTFNGTTTQHRLNTEGVRKRKIPY